MDTNEVSDNKGDSTSAGGGSSCDSGPVSSREKTWKTVVFVIVVVLAGTLAAHSLLTPASCGGCGGGGGRWMNTLAAGCPEQVAIKTAAYTADKPFCPGAEASFKSTGCPLAQEAGACPNSPGAPKQPCCPGGRDRWGQK